METASKWSEQIIRLLSIDYLVSSQDFQTLDTTLNLIERYTLISGRLYRLEDDNILRMCIEPDDTDEVIAEAHITIGGFHASQDKTENRIRCNGFWWPSISRDVARYIRHCPACIEDEPIAHTTLYMVMATPHWC